MKNVLKFLSINKIVVALVLLISFFVLVGSTKGTIRNGTLADQGDYDVEVATPLELSNSTSRYELTRSIVEKGSLFFDDRQLLNSAPDAVTYNGKHFTIFTPGISFLAVPFYAVGKYFGVPQIGAFTLNVVFGLISLALVAFLAKKLNAGLFASLLAGFTFLFATNAFGYSLTLTQHLVSTSLILLVVLNAIGKRSLLSNLSLGALFSTGLIVDIPNAFLMFPAVLFVIFKHFDKKVVAQKVSVYFRPVLLWCLIGLLPILIGFGAYNYMTADSPTRIAQNIGRVLPEGVELPIQNTEVNEKLTFSGNPLISIPFQTRNMLNGFYTLLISEERSWIFYSPVVILGLFGLFLILKNKTTGDIAALLITTGALNIVIYSMFGDPWGGWAFGPRYLIPAAAILSVGLAVLIAKHKNAYLVALFVILFSYSVFTSTLPVLTTNAIPPKHEAVSLNIHTEHTQKLNLGMLRDEVSSNLLYNSVFKDKIPLMLYWYLLSGLITLVGLFLLGLVIARKEKYAN